MIPLPRWAWPYLLNKTCPSCDQPTSLENVQGIGIREKDKSIPSSQKGNAILTFEYSCPICSQKSVWHADPENPDLSADDILQSIKEAMAATSSKKKTAKHNKVSKSKISNKEFEAFKKKLKECKTHEEFLNLIGIPKESEGKNKKDKKQDGDQTK